MKIIPFCLTLFLLSLSVPAYGSDMKKDKFALWINSNLDQSIRKDTTPKPDLKDDFYLAVNYNWLCDTEIPSGSEQISAMSTEQKSVNTDFLTLLKEHKLNGEPQDFFDIWMDFETRDKMGITEYIPHVKAIESITTLEDLSAYLTSDENLYYSRIFNLFTPYQNKDKSCLIIRPNALAFSIPGEANQNSEKVLNNMDIFESVQELLLPRFGFSEADITRIILNALDIEYQLASSMLTEEEWHSSEFEDEINSLWELEELEYYIDFPLAEMIKTFGYDKGEEYIVVEELGWLYTLSDLFTEENAPKLRDYILASYMMSIVRFADIQTYLEFYDIVGYSTENLPLENIAYIYVKNNCDEYLSDEYVKMAMTKELASEVESFAKDLIISYHDVIMNANWLSMHARVEECELLDDMSVRVGYTGYEGETLSFPYKTKEEGGTLFQLEEALSKNDHNVILSILYNPQDTEMNDSMSMITVNAEYIKKRNEIVIPAAMINSSSYDSDMSIEEKMANIGFIISHEISHAFSCNSIPESSGPFSGSMWSGDDIDIYADKVNQLVSFYDHLNVLGTDFDYSGNLIKDEAISDMASMSCLLNYANQIEDFDYDTFFTEFAKSWCSKGTIDYCTKLATYDTHPFNYLRVNLTLAQFPEFYETYSIKEGDQMYIPEEQRIKIW